MDFFRKIDIFPKTMEDFKVKTYSGAIVSIVSGVFICFLLFSEFAYYMQTNVTPELMVDTTRGDKMRITIDISFPHLPCSYLSVDVMDISGEQQLDVVHNVWKKRINEDGHPLGASVREQEMKTADPNEVLPNATVKSGDPSEVPDWKKPGYCGSCWGAEMSVGQCCNTCEDVRETYRKKGWAFSNPDRIEQCAREGWSEKLAGQANEGCNVYGTLLVNKVAGNFHFAPGKSFQQHHMHVHDLQPFKTIAFNMSHTIHTLSFGQDFPDMTNPLDGVVRKAEGGNAMYQYFVKIVPTIYERLGGHVIRSNQFSVTNHYREINHAKGQHGLPGVFFMYDLSPMMVRFTEEKKSFTHFLTGVCAIIGGVFTVAGMLDGMFYHSYRSLKAKVQLGKLS